MYIQQMGQRAVLAVGSWNWPSVVGSGLSLKSVKGNFHTRFSSEYKMLGRVAGASPMGMRVAVGKSLFDGKCELTEWQVDQEQCRMAPWILDGGRASEARRTTQLKPLSPTSLAQGLMIKTLLPPSLTSSSSAVSLQYYPHFLKQVCLFTFSFSIWLTKGSKRKCSPKITTVTWEHHKHTGNTWNILPSPARQGEV